LIALVDVELVDLDFGVAFRAVGHNLLVRPRAVRQGVACLTVGNWVDDVPESGSAGAIAISVGIITASCVTLKCRLSIVLFKTDTF
jgi:hypothetical protein